MTPLKFYTFLFLIILSLFLIIYTHKEEIKQPQLFKKRNDKQVKSYWQRNKFKDFNSLRQLIILILIFLFISTILFIHVIN